MSFGMGSRRKGSSLRSGAATGVALGAALVAAAEGDADAVDAGVEVGAGVGVVFSGVFAGVLAAAGFLDEEGFVLAGSAALRDSTPLQLRTIQTRTLFITAYLGSPPPYFNSKTSSNVVLCAQGTALPLDCVRLTA
jgi:hypothetical protein